ncbi:MAG: hypothetical protein HC783_13755 [Rhodobacteraceae bacterium]|nr:hypothetical protein [Paracoccaceae bacterium]
MHSAIVLGGAFSLLLACTLLGHAWGLGVAAGAKVFIGLWLLGAALNMWIGVQRAGYTVAQEAPIFLGMFGLPAAVAALIVWKWPS